MFRQPVLRALPRPVAKVTWTPKRSFFFRRSRPGGNGRVVERLNIDKLYQERREYDVTKRNFLVAGAVAGIVSFIYTAWKLKKELEKPTKADSTVPSTDTDAARKVVLHDEQGREVVPTGHSVVPTFPRTIEIRSFPDSSPETPPADSAALILPQSLNQTTEYTLVGLGTRTVSFLGISVYVLGFYVATADIAALQSRLVKRVNPIATTLVPGEKDSLRKALLDPLEGEELWDTLLKEGVIRRSAFRIMPVKDTDFHHLRDGFVRAIQGKSDKVLATSEEPADKDTFGDSTRQFRQAFNRGKVPKNKELLMVRDEEGRLRIVYSDGSQKRHQELIGTVDDERVSRALWLNYLGGAKVASEPARKSIADGVMEFVERPIGTVAAQVV